VPFNRLSRPLLTAAALAALAPALAGGYALWYLYRPAPQAQRRALFRGVTYAREVRRSPRPVVAHLVTIDLDDPGVHFLVTPGEPADGRHVRARTTSQFLAEFGAQVAINAGFFHPWHSNGPLDYYPHAGDPVSIDGLSVSQGRPYAPAKPGFETLAISEGNRVTIGGDPGGAYNAVSGTGVFVRGGRFAGDIQAHDEPEPRTAVALDATGRRLLLMVVDGRQPNYSEGVTTRELAEMIIGHGGHTALHLDGGGSSTLAAQGQGGRPAVLNTPIHGRVPPGRERPVGNHLGVFAVASPGPPATR
jgi:hypothetical protein